MYFFSYPIIVAYLLNLHPSQRSWCFAFHIRSNLYLLQSCSYQALLSWAEQVDHQGKLLLFQPVVICSLEMRLIPNARAQLMQAPEPCIKYQVGKGVLLVELQQQQTPGDHQQPEMLRK